MELLIKDKDDIDLRLGVQRSGALLKRNDVVFVAGDGHRWAREESLQQWIAEGSDPLDYPGHFHVVKVPGVLVDPGILAMNRPLERASVAGDPEYDDYPGDKKNAPRVLVHASKWRLRRGDLTVAQQQELETNSEITLSKAEMRDIGEHKADGRKFDERQRGGVGRKRMAAEKHEKPEENVVRRPRRKDSPKREVRQRG